MINTEYWHLAYTSQEDWSFRPVRPGLRENNNHLVCGDGDLLGLAGSLVLCRNLEDAVRVDLEGHLDLGYSSRCRREAGQLELT